MGVFEDEPSNLKSCTDHLIKLVTCELSELKVKMNYLNKRETKIGVQLFINSSDL